MYKEKKAIKNMKYCITFGIILICSMLFTTCNEPFNPIENNLTENGYGRVNILIAGGEARTIMPSIAFDKYSYTFTKTGGMVAVLNPDNGYFTLEAGNYTVEVKAYIGKAEPYTLAAAGVSKQFTVNSGSTVTIEVPLSEVNNGQGEFNYTITYVPGADAEITLKKWPELNDITLIPLTQGNVKTQTLKLDVGSYLLSVLVRKDGFTTAGISEVIHIYPSQSTEYTKDLTIGFDAIIVSNTGQWEAALNLIKNGGNGTTAKTKDYTIIVNGNVAVSGSFAKSFSDVTSISVTLNGNGRLYLTSPGYLLNIGASQTVYIDSLNLALQGLKAGQNGSSQDNKRAMIAVDSSGTLKLLNGITSDNIHDKIDEYEGEGGGVYVNGGIFTMSGGEISGNSFIDRISFNKKLGDEVYVNSGIFTMSGGEISSYFSISVCVSKNGTFTMSGGRVLGNGMEGVYVDGGIFTMSNGEVSGYSQGVVVLKNGTFTIGGGKVSNNSRGVYVKSGIFTISGGEISGNTSNGGVYVGQEGTFTMSGGEVSGNTSYYLGGGVYVEQGGTFTKKNGGTIYGYTSENNKSNVVKDSSGTVEYNHGSAVCAWPNNSHLYNIRNTTAGPSVNLDSSLDGSNGGWE
jgi:hypothetical protein